MTGPEPVAGADGAVVAREWDTGFFGFGVAEIVAPDADRSSLAFLLERCRASGVRLVYWSAREGRTEDGSLLAGFTGRLVDRKTTFARVPVPAPADEPTDPGWTVEEEAAGPASEELRRLAVASGAFSRFRVDPGIPGGSFEQLYLTWIDRSARRENADAVLVARAPRGILGMLTIEKRPAEVRIGLLAVDPLARGKGVGRSLLSAAEGWTAAAGMKRIALVTQGTNEAACRLYERAGYRVEEVRYVHHFWLGGETP